ncbi:MAG: DUF1573 domain-containing protein [Phycisphaerae bacterium]|nr:DUF1573 domain-containing protein [Phycisphaerae bacterium]
MSREYAIQGGLVGHGMRLAARLVLTCGLAAVLMGCHTEVAKDEGPAIQNEPNAVRADQAAPPTSPAATDAVQADQTVPAASETGPTDSATSARITVEKPVLDLGEIGTDSKVSSGFTFVNSGQDTLVIGRVHGCCGVMIRGVKDGQEYAPGEKGTLEFTYVTGSTPLSFKRDIRMETNDPDHKLVSLTIKASVVRRVETDPARLRLFLNQENAGCGPITIRSLDGKPFSIASFKSTANSISAQFDPNSRATEFVLKPQADMTKLQRNVRGVVSIDLTHPECGNVRLLYDVLPEFTVNPAHVMVFNIRPGQPMERDVWILSNYRDEFEIESVSSQKGYMKLVEKKKVGDRYQLRIEITPPALGDEQGAPASSRDGQDPTAAAKRRDKKGPVADMLEVKIKDGETLSIPFRGFYAAE